MAGQIDDENEDDGRFLEVVKLKWGGNQKYWRAWVAASKLDV